MLPHSGVPPQILGDRLYFRDEGTYEDDKRLSWLDVKPPAPKAPSRLVYFDEDTHLVGSEGPRWENVWSYGVAAGGGGTVWIATGNTIGAQTLIRWTPEAGYRVALYNDSTDFNGEFFAKDSWENTDSDILSVTGIEAPTGNGSFHAIGPKGMFEITNTQIKTLVRFRTTTQEIPTADGYVSHWNWIPTHLIALSPRVYFVGGHFGGLYLLKQQQSGGFQVVPLDDSPTPPLHF